MTRRGNPEQETQLKVLVRMIQTHILNAIIAYGIASLATAIISSPLDGFKVHMDFPLKIDNRIAMNLVLEYLTHYELTRIHETLQIEKQGRFAPSDPAIAGAKLEL
jgi:hypothetical protein